MKRLNGLRLLATVAAGCFALSAPAAVDARYNSPYALTATLSNISFNEASGVCTNPNFAHVNNDGIGTAFVLTTGNSQAGTNFGYSIGRYNPEADSYTGLMVEHYHEVTGQGYIESFYPFPNIALGTNASLDEVETGGGPMYDILINGIFRVQIDENLLELNTMGTGIIQAVASGGNPQYFAQFTTGSNCSSLAYGTNGPQSPWTLTPTLDTSPKPTLEPTANGSYANATWTVTY